MKTKQTIKAFIAALVIGTGLFFVGSAPVQAQECGGVQTSIITCDESGKFSCDNGDFVDSADATCSDGSSPQARVENTGLWGILILAINILTGLVGVAALGGIIYGAILYTSAGGSVEQTKKAMGIIMNVVIGIIAYGLMYVGLNFLIPGGVFN